MTRQLTARSNLETLKKEAKRWLKALRAGDPEASRRFQEAHPRAPERPGLREVQHALAREHGASGWTELREQLDDLVLAARSEADRAADLLELACLHYGVAPGARDYTEYSDSPDRRRRAARILERHPEVARHSLHTAVVCGDLAEVQRVLAARPAAAVEKRGREGWEPLLFLCYGRLPVPAAGAHAVEIARALLDHGADPDSQWSYDWEHRLMTWSALCGVIGDGENGPGICPPHPQAEALAALLLDRGAGPNQSQALYNTMLRGDDDRWLRLLIGRGLGPGDRVAWEGPTSQLTIFAYLLEHAVGMNQLRRATLLLESGASPEPGLHERALLGGNLEMAELLLRHGAHPAVLTGRQEFRAACMRRDQAAARRLLAAHPECLEDAGLLLVDEAAKRDLVEVARLLLDLGVSPDFEHPGLSGAYRALHQAACMNATGVATLLIERGASIDARDAGNQATPLGWALHTRMPATTALLARHTRDLFTLVAGGQTEALRARFEEDASGVNQALTESVGLGLIGGAPGETPLFVLPDDEELALEVAELLLAFGADAGLRNQAGQTAGEKARARGLEEVAELLEGRV